MNTLRKRIVNWFVLPGNSGMVAGIVAAVVVYNHLVWGVPLLVGLILWRNHYFSGIVANEEQTVFGILANLTGVALMPTTTFPIILPEYEKLGLTLTVVEFPACVPFAAATQNGVVVTNHYYRLEEAEKRALLEHELAHLRRKDTQRTIRLNKGMVWIGALIGGAIALAPIGGWGIFGWVLVSGFLLSCVSVMHRHNQEYRADREATLRGYGEAMISVIEKLGNLDSWRCRSTHPANNHRIQRIQRTIRRIVEGKIQTT